MPQPFKDMLNELIELEIHILESKARAKELRDRLEEAVDKASPTTTESREPKKRRLSPEAAAAISAATRQRWERYRAAKSKFDQE